jgi:hypothetical protein
MDLRTVIRACKGSHIRGHVFHWGAGADEWLPQPALCLMTLLLQTPTGYFAPMELAGLMKYRGDVCVCVCGGG